MRKLATQIANCQCRCRLRYSSAIPQVLDRPSVFRPFRSEAPAMNKLFAALVATTGLLGFAAASAAADFPIKGKPIEMIVPFAAGGPTDAAARLLATSLEQKLGTPVTVTNRPGASTQIGATQLARAKPDGHTIGFVSLPQLITAYLDPARKAVFSRKDLQPFALHVADPITIGVRADSPYRTLADLIAALKAKPSAIKGGTGGFMGTTHLAYLELERLAGVKFALVNFDGSAPGLAALLGGHIDVHMDTVAGAFARVKAGEIRVLAIADSQENSFLPGVRTFAAQGVPMQFAASRGLALPAETPKAIEATLSTAVREIIQSDDHKEKMTKMGQSLRYLGPEQFAKFWADSEQQVERLMETAKSTVTSK
ncbi:MAG: tripartite tricarboxylate transporter substrate binding protein [Lautropia sp.]